MKGPLQHHNHFHNRISRRHAVKPIPFEECRRCRYDKAVCEKKIRFATFVEADEWVLDFNKERGWKPPLMTRYRCLWCEQWHMKRAAHGRERARAQRVFRKWVKNLAAEDCDALLHWVRTGEVLNQDNERAADSGTASGRSGDPEGRSEPRQEQIEGAEA